MQKVLKIESFESYKISQKKSAQISGGRSKEFKQVETTDLSFSMCAKFIDNNDGSGGRYKFKTRYEGKC